jgi:hypothetical protein
MGVFWVFKSESILPIPACPQNLLYEKHIEAELGIGVITVGVYALEWRLLARGVCSKGLGLRQSLEGLVWFLTLGFVFYNIQKDLNLFLNLGRGVTP